MKQMDPGRPLVSACMIVKNEERNLERCLKSIKSFVDEIIVVDTGSTDRTKEIAAAFGARIFDHPWENDFSKHRNQSIGYATGDWIYIIDADEELILPKGPENMRAYLKKIPPQFPACALSVKDMQKGREVMTFNSTRFFRQGKIHYNRRVHNQPVIHGKAVLHGDAYMHHYGYDLDDTAKEAKFKRTFALLTKELEDNPKDRDVLFYLCQLHAEGNRDTAKAIEYGERYLRSREGLLSTGNNFNPSIYFTLFRIYLGKKDIENAKRILTMGTKDIPDDLDLAIAVIEFGIAVEDDDIRAEGATNFVRLYDQHQRDPGKRHNRFIYSQGPQGLAFALYHQAAAHIILGHRAVNNLMQTLETLPIAMKQGMMAELQEELKLAGAPILFTTKKKDGEGKNGDTPFTDINLKKEDLCYDRRL